MASGLTFVPTGYHEAVVNVSSAKLQSHLCDGEDAVLRELFRLSSAVVALKLAYRASESG